MQPVSDGLPRWADGRHWPELREIRNPALWITNVLPLLWGLACRDTYSTDDEIGHLTGGSQLTTVRLGPQIPQRRLARYSAEQSVG